MKFLIFGFSNLLEQLFNGVKLEKLSHKHDCLKDNLANSYEWTIFLLQVIRADLVNSYEICLWRVC
jgi:hypothetical protein